MTHASSDLARMREFEFGLRRVLAIEEAARRDTGGMLDAVLREPSPRVPLGAIDESLFGGGGGGGDGNADGERETDDADSLPRTLLRPPANLRARPAIDEVRAMSLTHPREKLIVCPLPTARRTAFASADGALDVSRQRFECEVQTSAERKVKNFH